jgi:acyl transferase domain-containing protein/NADPH:quinone reductase-like Zn-dependent oxidoreductase
LSRESGLAARIEALSAEKRALLRRASGDPSASPPVAIVGLGCRFPGGDGPEAFWQALRDGRDAVTEVPASRWDVEAYYDPDPSAPGKTNSRCGGFLENVDGFDAGFFGISPREASRIDPQQRLLLEVAWEALEDAGQVVADLAGRAVGVFVGVSTGDYGILQAGDLSGIDAYSGTGNSWCMAANRLSYVLGLRGPSLVLDTACSSSLVALHQACRSLEAGESELALAAGVNLVLLPLGMVSFTKLRALAADGRCKAFDARADGIVRGEGVAVVALKRLSHALADGDRVHAVIRGTAVNNDGHTNGLTAPSRRAQEQVLRDAYRRAGVDPAQVSYVETHGTGTVLGDPIEAQALGAVLAKGRPPHQPCRIGSVKTNIGHLEAAAGLAGVVKVVLALRHGALPPSLHFEAPNPHIDFDALKLRVVSNLEAWPDGGPRSRIAGVSSFGFGGTNAHVVLEAAPAPQPVAEPLPGPFLLPLSARDPKALIELAQRYRDRVLGATEVDAADPGAVCAWTALRRDHHDHRLAVVGSTREELRERLDDFLRGAAGPGLAAGRRLPGRRAKIVFVFPGQGPRWWPLDGGLLQRSARLRETLEECDRRLRPHWRGSVLDDVFTAAANDPLERHENAQPLLFAVQVALARLWQSLGLQPDAVLGQSVGEVAAAHVAGALDLDEAARVIVGRGAACQSVSGRGRMAVVDLSAAEAERAIAGEGGAVTVASFNAPRSTVLSGTTEALERIAARLESAGAKVRFVEAVDFASHGPQMEAVRGAFAAALGTLRPRPAAIRFDSTVTPGPMPGEDLDASYWFRNLRQPVRFLEAVHRLVDDGHSIFLEISPHAAMTTSLLECLESRGTRDCLVLPTLRRGPGAWAHVLRSVAGLYAAGLAPEWRSLHPSEPVPVSLPAYPWQRQRHWLPLPGAPATRLESGRYPLLGRRFDAAGEERAYWQAPLGRHDPAYLDDHRIGGAVLLPGAAFIEMGLELAAELRADGPSLLRGVEFSSALWLNEGERSEVQVKLSHEAAASASFEVYSRLDQAPAPTWTMHAAGTIETAAEADPEPHAPSLAAIRERCTRERSGAAYYATLARRGLDYGPSFQAIGRLWCGAGEALAEVCPPAGIADEAPRYRLHPALLDAALQAVGAAIDADAVDAAVSGTMVPVLVERIRLDRAGCAGPLWSHARLTAPVSPGATMITADVSLLDIEGRSIAEVSGLHLRPLEGAVASRAAIADQGLYAIEWNEIEPTTPPAVDEPGTWLLLAGGSRLADELAAGLRARGQRCLTAIRGRGFVALGGDRYETEASPEALRELVRAATRASTATDANGANGAEHGEHGIDGSTTTDAPLRGIVHLWSLDSDLDALESSVGALHLIQALVGTLRARAPRLWLVTRGAQAVEGAATAVDPGQAPLWGLGRTLRLEHPELRCVRVDLDPEAPVGAASALVDELLCEAREGRRDGGRGDAREDEIAYRGGREGAAGTTVGRYASRLARFSSATEDEARGPAAGLDAASFGEEPFGLRTAEPGRLDALALASRPRGRCGPGQIEIEVVAAGLNFMDVLAAQGLLPGTPQELGGECAGRVVTVGPETSGFAVGDVVMALAPGSFGTHAITDAMLAVQTPRDLDFEAAATVPIAFLTASYALRHQGRMERGEKVLIHAAAGGVGLAAIQLAQLAGAETFATVGSPEKRELLESMGVQHIFSTRSLAFADEVLAATDGRGVDLVLNSLGGDFIPAGIRTLAPYGRFLEIGKADIYRNRRLGLEPFQRNLSFFAIDLARIAAERPALVQALLSELRELLVRGEIRPIPYRAFAIDDAVSAFRHLARRRAMGKVVLSLPVRDAAAAVVARASAPIRGDATYLVSGGLGGLGLAVAGWLVERGARHLALVGRSSPSEAAAQAVAAMRERGASVHVTQGDVASTDDVQRIFASVRTAMPRLRGVVHAAGVLDDGILLHQTRERFEAVAAPKIRGAWNLHQAALEEALDFFVMFSSLASVVGSPGQATYSAANAFLDALAHHRRSLGHPAQSINWGPWSEIGLAAERADRLASRGLGPISPRHGLDVLEKLLLDPCPQVVVALIDWSRWVEALPALREVPLLRSCLSAEARPSPVNGHGGRARGLLLAATLDERPALARRYLCEQASRVLGIPCDRIDVEIPLNDLGLDSLSGAELKHQVEAGLGVFVSMVSVLQNPSIASLADELLGQLSAGDGPLIEPDMPLPAEMEEFRL